MSHSETFIDGILNVALVKGLVRIDLYSLSATEVNADGSAKPEFRERLVLHPNVLPEILRTMQLAVAALRERGLLQGGHAEPQEATIHAAVTGSPVETIAAMAGTSGEEADSGADRQDRRPRSRNFPSTLS